MYTFQIIDENEYSRLECMSLFEVEGKKTYAKIEYGDAVLKFAYSSDVVKPEIIEFGEQLIIGIDLDVCLYRKNTQSIAFHLQTDCFFGEFLVVKDKLIVFTELDVYLIDLKTFEIEFKFSYPDIYTSYQFCNNKLKMKYMDGNEEVIDLEKFFKL